MFSQEWVINLRTNISGFFNGSLSSHPCPSSPWNGLDSTKEPDDSRCRSHLKTVLRQGPQNPVIRVKLNENPTLPCSQTCSSLVTWTVYHKPDDILAQCNQTSCQSKEGFHMSHDQYLKGDFSLTITDVEFNKRAWYTCSCSGKTLCDWNLQVHAFSFKVHVHRGESLSMNVPISEPVEVILNRTGDTKPTTVRLCEITGREVQCVSEYGKRVSFSSSLQLKGLKESDSGVYTIQDTSNEEVIATYTVTTATFGGMKEEPDTHTVLAVVLPLVILILLVSAVVLFRNRLQNC
ncbi:uncharacterized protein LOC113589898 [Electrophorus electricus]|uniref:uncharacterized protein LOC113589898 n=1 Tax=Electrophorus electricus TaxID=8005 RepID=UPI0015D064BC|nr:uncharacterized protein LOC113589898 [Electrophorus electricus]